MKQIQRWYEETSFRWHKNVAATCGVDFRSYEMVEHKHPDRIAPYGDLLTYTIKCANEIEFSRNIYLTAGDGSRKDSR